MARTRTLVFDKKDMLGFTSDADLGERIEMTGSAVRMIRHGHRGVNGQFIAGVLLAFPSMRFEDLFRCESER